MQATTQNPTQQTQAYWDLVTDILSQAITGELIGMSNFASLAETIDDVEEKMEAVEHANSERFHAIGFMDIAKKYNLEPKVNLAANYWRRARETFLKWAKRKDFTACLLIQEVILECYAVSMYKDVGEVLPDDLGRLFLDISREEEEHLEHSIELLQAEMERDPEGFTKKVEEVHLDCMTIMAEWSAKTDLKGHCEVCKGNCMKESLYLANLDITTLRGHAMSLYLNSLDRIGVPGEKSIVWMANLPA
ncbi:MAG: hypothetical protein DA408_15675 [Bacteroidetes bacterium]|nr:MAG: hypothetical protein C7N36_05505 [Bacteroidota bacterium]PTM10606.1 MAG: hypothetical protein DA408_15675 [Bacteroidota bacterium]